MWPLAMVERALHTFIGRSTWQKADQTEEMEAEAGT